MSSAVREIEVITNSAAGTRRLGQQVGRWLRGGDVILLSGDLGAGKTTFAQGVASGLGVVRPVASPTFTLVAEYAGHTAEGTPVTLCHVDLYRVAGGGVETLGLDDYLGAADTVAVVEWPQCAPEALPATALVIEFTPLSETKRRLTLRAHGPEAVQYQDRLTALREEVYGVIAR